ncbi:PQQ-binding-like beta-propeller repeat protein [Haloplanus halobius]|uniref:outer membrane protein assembly factor BamB family protein n=1 Tax=Haloplanus halobius TaxID=2934938 RepID=UPI002010B4AD|nr:PQQ-binding-like beta-propeller repeat protein [Haloplanus sp. XH21]
MPSIQRRTFLGTLSVGLVGLAGCSSSCPDSDGPTPDTVVDADETGTGFDRHPGGAWPAPRFDAANTGYAPSRRLPTGTPTLRWRTTLSAPVVDDAEATVSSPTVADGRVYLTTGDGVFALGLRDGETRWNVSLTPAVTGPPVRDSATLAPPVVAGDTVCVATADGLTALDIADGATVWQFTDAQPTGTPVVVDATVVVPTTTELVALDAATGDVQWSAAGADATLPAVADGTLVAALDGLAAIDAATGERRWVSPVRTDAYPVIDGDTVYLGTDEGLVGVALADGTMRWTVDRGSGRTFSAPVVTPETIYAAEQPVEAGDATFAFDRVDDGPPEPRWCSSVGEGSVTAATASHAVALQAGHSDRRPPVRLVAFTARFGEATWGYADVDPAMPPAILDGGVVTVTRRGTVVAFGGV